MIKAEFIKLQFTFKIELSTVKGRIHFGGHAVTFVSGSAKQVPGNQGPSAFR